MQPAPFMRGTADNGETFVELAATVGNARFLTEDRFLALGQDLEAAVEILHRLTGRFQDLRTELESPALGQAMRDIAQAAAEVPALSVAYREEREILHRITEASCAIDARVARMHKAVKAVDALGVRAKIEAVQIGAAGTDFLAFANEIDRSLKLAQANLDKLEQELLEVTTHLQRARMGERAFGKRFADALELIPARLAASTDAMAGRRDGATAASGAVAQRSAQVSDRIAEVVMSLQIGDTTRQRIEHVEAAIALLRDRRAAEPPPSNQAAEHACQANAVARDTPVTLACRLLSAQLTDTAEAFDHDMTRVHASLRELSENARAITDLGEHAYGSTREGRGAFLLDLEKDVADTCALLDGFREARRGSDEAVASVRAAASRLAAHIGLIRSLEADIRMMSLNTTLKAGRLGKEGRPLVVIAQELRAFAGHTAVEADATMAGLECINGLIAAISDERQTRRAGDIAAVSAALTGAVGRLGQLGHGLADALATLRHDGAAVTDLVDGAITRLAFREELGGALRWAAAEFLQRAGGVTPAAPSDDDLHLLARIATSYTMARERQVHAVMLGDTGLAAAPSPPQPAPAEADFADVLF